ncbi:hypothetical protein ACJX0J_010340, partial [Zea mays]
MHYSKEWKQSTAKTMYTLAHIVGVSMNLLRGGGGGMPDQILPEIEPNKYWNFPFDWGGMEVASQLGTTSTSNLWGFSCEKRDWHWTGL